jgi:hypothetical protein
VGLRLSVFGLPVERSIGSPSQTTLPHNALPQSLRRTLSIPSCESQIPSMLPARATLDNINRPMAAVAIDFIEQILPSPRVARAWCSQMVVSRG